MGNLPLAGLCLLGFGSLLPNGPRKSCPTIRLIDMTFGTSDSASDELSAFTRSLHASSHPRIRFSLQNGVVVREGLKYTYDVFLANLEMGIHFQFMAATQMLLDWQFGSKEN